MVGGSDGSLMWFKIFRTEWPSLMNEKRNSLKCHYISLVINHRGIHEKNQRVGDNSNPFFGLEQGPSFISDPSPTSPIHRQNRQSYSDSTGFFLLCKGRVCLSKNILYPPFGISSPRSSLPLSGKATTKSASTSSIIFLTQHPS